LPSEHWLLDSKQIAPNLLVVRIILPGKGYQEKVCVLSMTEKSNCATGSDQCLGELSRAALGEV